MCIYIYTARNARHSPQTSLLGLLGLLLAAAGWPVTSVGRSRGFVIFGSTKGFELGFRVYYHCLGFGGDHFDFGILKVLTSRC